LLKAVGREMRRRALEGRAGPYAALVPTQADLDLAADAGRQLRTLLTSLYLTEQCSAQKLCSAAWYHMASGGCGLDDLALDPRVERPTGHYNAFIKLVLGREFGDPSLSYISTPMYDKRNACRSNVMVPIMRPTEAMSQYLLGHQNAVDANDLQAPLPLAFPDAAWTPEELSNQVIQDGLAKGFHLSRLRRVGIFMDDAGFTKNESFHAIYLNDVSSSVRFLLAILRKAEICQCGCRGFCTFWCIHDALLSDLQDAAVGRWSSSELDEQPFQLGTPRGDRAGLPMGICLACTEMRADMPGYTGPMGFRSSSHGSYPCPCCNIRKANIGDLNNVSLDGGEWDPFTDVQYYTEIAKCLITVQITTPGDIANVLAAPLDYDHRKTGGFLGRRLLHDVGLASGERLLLGDRLHPSRVLRDVANFEFTPVPFTCQFWRCNPKTARVLHLSPLMRLPGVGMRTWRVDILHAWHLGSLPRLLGKGLWFVLRGDVYGIDARMPWLYADDTLQLNLLQLRSELFGFYKQQARNDPNWNKTASRVWNITIKMLGKEANPVLKTKANETAHLVPFLVHLLERHAPSLEPVTLKFLLASARSAAEVNDIIRSSPRVLTPDVQQNLMNAYVRHCAMYVRAGGNLVPKHHLMLHCLQLSGQLGNPKYYSCYRDESLNGVLVKIARSAHRLTFMETVHKKFRILEKIGGCMQMY
jgi:hypothetical protein